MKVTWTARARTRLAELHDYIAQDSKPRALAMFIPYAGWPHRALSAVGTSRGPMRHHVTRARYSSKYASTNRSHLLIAGLQTKKDGGNRADPSLTL
jgi:hypothetical protein